MKLNRYVISCCIFFVYIFLLKVSMYSVKILLKYYFLHMQILSFYVMQGAVLCKLRPFYHREWMRILDTTNVLPSVDFCLHRRFKCNHMNLLHKRKYSSHSASYFRPVNSKAENACKNLKMQTHLGGVVWVCLASV